MVDNHCSSGGPEAQTSPAAAGQSSHDEVQTPSAPHAAPGQSIPRRVFFRLLAFSWTHFLIICACCGAWLGRFLFPNVRFEPPTRFKIGKPEDFLPGEVDTRFKKRYGIWIVRTDDRIFAVSTVCTHLGCTPNWLPAEEKFKCPCHGSGFSKEGLNFEGPAPRALERFLVTIDDTGAIVVDKSVAFRQEKAEWDMPDSFIAV